MWVTLPLSSLTNVIVASTTLRKNTVSDSGKISNLGWSVSWVIRRSPSRVIVAMTLGASS